MNAGQLTIQKSMAYDIKDFAGRLRNYFSSIGLGKIFSIITIIALAAAIPITVLNSQKQQQTRQHAASPYISPSPTQTTDQKPPVKDADEINQLTNQLLQLNKHTSLEPESVSEPAQKIKNQIKNSAIEIAKKRKDLLLKLAKKNPRLFLTIALKKNTQSSMSSDIQSYLEKEVTVEGKTEVFHVDDFKNPENSKFSYFLKIGNERVNFFPTQELSIASGARVRVKGIQLDNTIAATTDKASFQVLEQAPQPESVGDQKTLVLLMRFQNSGNPPFTKEKAYDLIFNDQFQKFYKEQSYNQVSFSGDVFGWFTLNYNNTGDACDVISISDLSKYINDNNIDPARYSRLVFLVDTSYSGCSYVGKIDVTINNKVYRLSEAAVSAHDYSSLRANHPLRFTTLDFVLSHELGHSLGLSHANGWDCKDQTLYGECNHIEYGNYFDTMGYGYYSLHFNSFYKELLGWINPSSELLISNSGTYTINPLETDSAVKLAKIKIQGFDITPFYLEYRKGIGFDAILNNPEFLSNQSGLFVNHIVDRYYGSFTRLLDMTPTSLSWYDDIQQATLNGGNIFTDAGTGITLGPVKTTDDSSITFDVKLINPTCTPQEPLLSSSYYSESVAAGGLGWIGIKFTNRDSFACGESEFKIVPILPLGWDYSLYPAENITVAPDQEAYPNINFNVPENAPTGNTLLGFDIVNTKSGLKAHSEFSITVKPPAKITRIDPQAGTIGTKITIFGSGFDETLSKNTINIYSYNSQSYSYHTEIVSEISQIQGEQIVKFTVPDTITNCISSGGAGAPIILGGGGGGDSTCSKIPTPLGTYYIYVFVENLTSSNTVNFEVIAPPTPTPTPSGNLPCGNIGDINGDGKIGIVDSVAILQYAAGTRTFTDDEKKRADVNGNGQISAIDSAFIQRYIVKLITTFPACPK